MYTKKAGDNATVFETSQDVPTMQMSNSHPFLEMDILLSDLKFS